MDHFPSKGDTDCITELRWLYNRRDLGETKRDLDSWLSKWQDKYPKLCEWVEENIVELHENWLEEQKYINMELLKANGKEVNLKTKLA